VTDKTSSHPGTHMTSPGSLDDSALYDYELPAKLIAQMPAEPRDHSRLMVLHKRTKRIEHRYFFQIVEYLRKGDLLVLNDTKVLHCRLRGTRRTGGAVEVCLVEEMQPGLWKAFVKARGRILPGEPIRLEEGRLEAVLECRSPDRTWTVRFQRGTDVAACLEEVGRAPLPPYIRRPQRLDQQLRDFDRERYQTVFAAQPGAVAAPTAGLHFTPGLLDGIRQAGVGTCYITLHVGLGTFRPIRAKSISQHVMHPEFFVLSRKSADAVTRTRSSGGRVICVGTTCCRALETAGGRANLAENSGWTRLYIRPPFEFRVVNALVTNFHLPRTTLLVLVSTFAGRTFVMQAYKEAVDKGYRFYSYGDAMLIVDD